MSARILIVDDNRTSLLLLKEMLSEEYEVATFIDPVEALYNFSSESFDLVISDLRMPEMHGVELFKKIRETEPDIPFIIVSASDDKENVNFAYRAGIDKYIFKPIKIPVLLNTVKSSINPKNKCV